MAFATNNLTQVEARALTALAAGGQLANLLAPSAATSAAVSDILAAAGEVVSLVNTANAALSTFAAAINDPITTSFSNGQPYGGTFITSPTVTQITPVNFNQILSSSTQTLAQISAEQIAALSAQTGVIINTDADLAAAMAVVFANTAAEFKLSFSINLSDTAAITPLVHVPISVSRVVSIPPLTAKPNIAALSNFITTIASSFPNTPGIAGVAASIWVDNLGVAVNVFGASAIGVPPKIDRGVYGDISGVAGGITDTVPISLVDYSFQQNQFNLTVALAIDHGMTTTLMSLLGSSLVTPATYQAIKNRLSSVASRGDAAMLSAMFIVLGVNNIPNPLAILTTLISSLGSNNQTVFAASGITISTTTNNLTTGQIISYITTMLTLTGLTANDIFQQSTCDSVLCSQSLFNVELIKGSDAAIVAGLLDDITIKMASMF